MSSLHLLICVAVICLSAEADRILVVVPTPSISHQVVYRPLTQELARRGHAVTVITTDPAFPKGKTPQNLTEIDLHDMSYTAWQKEIFQQSKTSGNVDDLFEQMRTILSVATKIFGMQVMTDEVQKVLNQTDQFDLLIIESCAMSSLSLTHIFKVPVISMSSFGGILDYYEAMGAPNLPPLLYPTMMRQKLNNLSLWDKLTEFYNHFKVDNIIKTGIKENDKAIKQLFGEEMPSISELMKNIDLLFLNVHPIWEFNRPLPPNVINLGGLHQAPTKELPKDLKSFLDSSKNGVIYISYGTNVDPSLLPAEKIQTLVQAFSELPYDVLWKWNKDELPNRPQNVKISKWLPQADLLKHPNVKVFITQGGLQSTDEAITAGVPLIGMPMLADQWYNVEMYVYHQVGVRLDMADATKENFKLAINTVIKDVSYRKNMERLRSVMKDQHQKPLERAVWWTEHLLRHGDADHLKARAAHMSWSEYLDLQLLLALALGALLVIIAISFVSHLIYSFVRNTLLTGSKLKKF